MLRCIHSRLYALLALAWIGRRRVVGARCSKDKVLEVCSVETLESPDLRVVRRALAIWNKHSRRHTPRLGGLPLYSEASVAGTCCRFTSIIHFLHLKRVYKLQERAFPCRFCHYSFPCAQSLSPRIASHNERPVSSSVQYQRRPNESCSFQPDSWTSEFSQVSYSAAAKKPKAMC